MNLQAVQNGIPFFEETKKVPIDSDQGETLAAVQSINDFVRGELDGIEDVRTLHTNPSTTASATRRTTRLHSFPRDGPAQVVAALVEQEPWLEAEDVDIYFAFETKPGFTFRVRRICSF